MSNAACIFGQRLLMRSALQKQLIKLGTLFLPFQRRARLSLQNKKANLIATYNNKKVMYFL